MPAPALQLPVNRASLPSVFYPTNPFLPSAATAAAVRGGIRRGRHSGGRGICCSAEKAAPSLVSAERRPVAVKAVVTVLQTIGGEFAHLGWTRGLDDITDLRGRTLLLELISAELDPKTGSERKGVEAFARRVKHGPEQETYEASFSVPAGFGEIGAVYVKNEHHEEMYIRDIILDIGSGDGEDGDGTTLTFSCRSWVASKFVSPEPRVFFPSNKSYLPYETPSGLLRARAEELVALRGNGTGERKKYDRIYDYATYDDLGDPDMSPDLTRPVLGGNKEYPYPRRCRTGRPMSKRDPQAEVRGSEYVPRDENFSEIKNESFSVKTLRSVVHMLLPSLKTAMVDTKLGFPYFTAIDTLFDEGMPLPKDKSLLQVFRDIVPRLIKAVEQGADGILQFEVPEMIERDTFSWFRDEEFSRQTLAGLNPLTIQLVTEFPFVSKLDPKIYGPPESLITKELIEREIKEKMTVEEALKQKKLFILDYYDLFLPYVHKIREIEGTTLYASRTVFFLTQQGTLQPIAIELTRPASPTKPQWKEVFTPCWDATGNWLWRMAKTHAVAHDTGFHQLVSHWLRTHCCVEPYVIATNRQLSQMHPINRLLHPHFRYTMEINALARMYLINAGGIIEDTFFPRKYSMEISSVVYGKLWRFDMEALPNDLIRRGMAVEDPQAEHGLKLTIEDYPYAQDGLLIWKAIEQWVSDYVNHYYQTAAQVKEDTELQAWWTEVRTRGHGDKKDEPWWPVLNSQADLIQVLCTIIWVASCHHAAVNFGQYQYGGYFPNRPTIARTNMPVEDGNEAEMARFMEKPESTMLRTFPSQIQATLVMAILDVLSSHSPDEEYMGTDAEPAWELNPLINAAFERFSGRMKEIEGIIDAKNRDTSLKNRCGAGIVPYELLKPFSKPGVTGMGVPKSISI